MTAVTASFPAYHSTSASFHAGIPATILPEGMRELGMYEMEYVGGAGLLSGIRGGFRAMVSYCARSFIGGGEPEGEGMLGAFIGGFISEF